MATQQKTSVKIMTKSLVKMTGYLQSSLKVSISSHLDQTNLLKKEVRKKVSLAGNPEPETELSLDLPASRALNFSRTRSTSGIEIFYAFCGKSELPLEKNAKVKASYHQNRK